MRRVIDLFSEDLKTMDIFQGFIAAFGFNFPPRNWAQCSGQMMAIADNQALYSLLGTFYGGDARVTYGIPELRGRIPIGFGTEPGQPTYPIGKRVGSVLQTLGIAEMPQHTHTAVVTGGGGAATGALFASTANGLHEQPEAGDFLATGLKIRGDVNKNYVPAADKGTTVELGGLDVQGASTPPTVVNSDAGVGASFEIVQPITAINYSIAMLGIYPPRN